MKKNGFTLVELLAVISVIAILILFATPAVTGLMDQSGRKTFKSETISLVKDFEKAYARKSSEGIGTALEKSKVAKVVHNFGDGDKNYYYLCMELSDLVNENYTNKNLTNYKGYIETYIAVNTDARYTFVSVNNGNYEIKGSLDEVSSNDYKVINAKSNDSDFYCFGSGSSDEEESNDEEDNSGDAMLIPGPEFNAIVKNISRNQGEIKQFDTKSSEPADLSVTTVVSTPSSSSKVYLWYDDGVLRLYSSADKIYLNQNASKTFANFESMKMGRNILDLSRFDTSKVEDMSYLFYGSTYLRNPDLSHFDTSKVTNMSHMFEDMLFNETLDVSKFNTSNVTDMSYMFDNNVNLLSLNISNFDTSKVTNMKYMFYRLESIKSLDLSNFNTSNVEDMSWMFNSVKSITSLDLSHFDTSKVTDMGAMFQFMRNLEYLNLSSFDTSKNTSMYCMFRGIDKMKKLDLSNFNTDNLEEMFYAFMDSNFEEIDLSSFNTSRMEMMSRAFYNMPYLTTVYVGDGWTTSNIKYSSYDVFDAVPNLIGGSGTKANGRYGSSMARIDCPSNKGFFTYKGPLGDTAAYCRLHAIEMLK